MAEALDRWTRRPASRGGGLPLLAFVRVVARTALLACIATAITLLPGWPATSSAALGLTGTLLVARPNAISLVDPLSADSTVLPVGAAGTQVSSAAWSPLVNGIATSERRRQVGERAPGADIVVLDASGAEVWSVPRDAPEVVLSSPTWLPSGELVYERSLPTNVREPARIEASVPDGSSRRLLATGAHLPGVSADGGSLAYVQSGGGVDALVLQDLGNGSVRTLIPNVDEGYYLFSAPRFSPDGRLVAFGASGGPNVADGSGLGLIGTSFWHGTLLAGPRGHGPSWDVWSIGVDGTGLRQVTRFDYEDDLSVAWSPDGAWLAAYSPNALYLVPVVLSGPAVPIAAGGTGEPDWAPTSLQGPTAQQ